MLTSSGEHLSIWTKAAVQHPGLMGRNLDISHKCRITPNAERVVGEAARTDKLPVVVAELETCDLRTGVDTVHSSTCSGIPEVDVSVVRSASSCEQIELPWAPTESLDCCTMILLAKLWSAKRSRVPDRDKIVVATRSELSTIRAPLETTNFGCVGD